MEKRNDLMIAVVLIISIIGQIVSYVAVDHILDRVLSKQQIVVTVSGNETGEIVTETAQISEVNVKVEDFTTKPKGTENEPIEVVYQPTGVLTPQAGVNWYGDQKETYYNLPMTICAEYARQRIEGMENAEEWINESGCKMLGDYIMIAANQEVHPYGSLVETSLGTGIVVDTGGFALTNPNQVDIAVNW